MTFDKLSNLELIDLFGMLYSSLGSGHSLVMRVQEELFMRMETRED